jgi:hypothetical protein
LQQRARCCEQPFNAAVVHAGFFGLVQQPSGECLK